MRILILTQHYDPEPIPKPGELARALRDRGHQITVVTGFPNYPEGHVYPGFRVRAWRREVVDGIDVLRTWIYPYHGRSVRLRIANYLSFMLSPLLAAALARACDVIYVVHPPLTIGVPARMLSLLKRAPFIYDVQDIWSDSVVETGMLTSPALMRLMDVVARRIYRRAALILAITAGARKRLIEKGAPADRVAVPLLWVTDALFRRPDATRDVRAEFGLQDRFIVMFAGNLGVVQKLDVLIDAAERLRRVERALLVIVGDGLERPRLESLVRVRGLTNVRFLGRQPFSAMPDFLAAADVLLVHLKRTALSDFLVPAKVLSYLATGRPLIVAMEGPAADLVSRIGAGVAVPPEDPAALAEAVGRFAAMSRDSIEQMGRAGEQYLRAENSPRQVLDEYERLLQSVCERRPPVAQSHEPVVPC